MRPTIPSLAAAVLLSACAATSPVSLSSDPPGAHVFVNGVDSGFTTPCVMSLDKDEDHEVAFVLDGYLTAERSIVHGSTYETILWREMSVLPKTWRFPLWLNLEDFFVPVKRRFLLKPSRIFVRMNRSADR